MIMPLSFFGRSTTDAREKRAKSQMEPVEDFSPAALVAHRKRRNLEERNRKLTTPEAVLAFFRGERKLAAASSSAAGFTAKERRLLGRMGFSPKELDAIEASSVDEVAATQAAKTRR